MTPPPSMKAHIQKQVRLSLEAIYPDRAGDFTQALMELGATVCGPNRKPDCRACPCKDFCVAFKNSTAEQLPVKQQKKSRRVERMTVLLLTCDGKIALRKRENKGLLAGLWEFPHLEGKLEIPELLTAVEEIGLKPTDIIRTVERKHIFTHIEWDMCGVYLRVKERAGAFCWLTSEQVEREAALPTAFRQFWEEIENV